MVRFSDAIYVAALLAVVPTGAAAGQSLQDTVHLQRVAAAGRSRGSLPRPLDNRRGLGEQTIFLKNTADDQAIVIVGWRVFDCQNIRRRNCGTHQKGPTIEPGKTVRLTTVRRQDEGQAYAFHYEFTAEYAEEQSSR